jgi:hypothetical protein
VVNKPRRTNLRIVIDYVIAHPRVSSEKITAGTGLKSREVWSAIGRLHGKWGYVENVGTSVRCVWQWTGVEPTFSTKPRPAAGATPSPEFRVEPCLLGQCLGYPERIPAIEGRA